MEESFLNREKTALLAETEYNQAMVKEIKTKNWLGEEVRERR